MTPLYTETEFQNAGRADLLPLKCLQCETTFQLSRRRIKEALNPNRRKSYKNADFCSPACANTHRDPPIIVQCLQCQVSFRKQPNQARRYPNHFCNRSCRTRYANTHKVTGTRVSKLEKWLQTQLPTLYPELEFQFNRKDVINSELDIYCPSLKLAFELNGIFHYEPIYGPEKLAGVQNNDQRKFQACIEHGIELCLIDVSRMTNFKEVKALKFLEIIQAILREKNH